MYAITHFDRGRLVTERRYTAQERIKRVHTPERKLFTLSDMLIVVAAFEYLLLVVS